MIHVKCGSRLVGSYRTNLNPRPLHQTTRIYQMNWTLSIVASRGLSSFQGSVWRSASIRDSGCTMCTVGTRRTFQRLNMRKAAGPDGIMPRLLRLCANELCGFFTNFNWSLRLCTVPVSFKRSVIIPVPKRSPVSYMNDYRPVAYFSCGKEFWATGAWLFGKLHTWNTWSFPVRVS